MKNFLLLFFLTTTVYAQVPSISWVQQDSLKEYMYGGIEASDGSYITVGLTNFGEHVIKKTQCNGTVSWTVQYGTLRNWGVRETVDHNYIVVGDTASDARLTKVDTAGNILWERGYIYSSPNEHGYGIDLTPDGGYILLSNYVQLGCRIIKTDSIGILQWDTLYTNFENAMAIVTSANYTYTFLSSQGLPFDSVYLTQIDAAGGIVWKRAFGGHSGPSWSANSLIRTTDGGFAFVATDASKGCLYKTDMMGNLQWKKFLFPGYAYSMSQTPDSGYLVSGVNYGTYLMKTNAVGDSLWSYRRSPVFSSSQVGFPTSDSGYFYAACCDTALNTDFSIKFNYGGTPCTIPTTIPEITKYTPPVIFPNPVFTKANINTGSKGSYTFSVTDISGNEVLKFSFTGQHAEFNKGNLSPGLYLYQLQNEKGVAGRGKILVE